MFELNNLRHEKILLLLQQYGSLSIEQLIEQLKVSPATVRRDIVKLQQQGSLRKIKNGITCVDTSISNNVFHALEEHLKINGDKKEKIANAALKYCNYGDSIILTNGSTIFLLGKKICKSNMDIQIISNYLPLIFYLIQNQYKKLFILGGQYNQTQSITLFSQETIESKYSANVMFTSARSLTYEGIYKNDLIISFSEQQMLKKVNKLIVLIDSSKIGVKHGTLFCPIEKIDVLITDKKADPTIIKFLESKNIEVVLV